jgi:hypothetical protein
VRAARRSVAGLILAVALLAAGCGGSSTSATGESGSAEIVPASAPVFVSVDTDLSSQQWQQVDTLLAKFPGRAKFLAQLRKSFEEDAHGVTWEDVKAAVGPEVGIAVLDFEKGTVVGLTQPKDEARWEELLRKGNQDPEDKLYSIDYQGWKVFSDKQAKLERFKQAAGAGDKLSDDATFKDAMGGLADAALVKVYANGTRLTAEAKQVFERLNAATPTQGKLRWLAGDVVAENDGMRLDVRSKSEGAKLPSPYTATLLDTVPSGVLALLSFSGDAISTGDLRKQFEQGFKGAGGGLFPQAQQLLPILEQLATLFQHETALYVRPGAGIPEVTLVALPDSPQKGVAAIDKLVRQLSGLAGANLKPKPVAIGSVKAKEVNLGRFSIFYGVDGKRVVVSNVQQAFLDLKASSARVANDPTFKEAKEAAGLPDQTNGFLYVNLKDAIPLVTGFAQLSGARLDPELRANLRPLRAVVAWEAADGGNGNATLFLEVK